MCIGQSDTIYSSMCLKICCVFHGHYFSLFDLFGQNQYCLSVVQSGNQPNDIEHSLPIFGPGGPYISGVQIFCDSRVLRTNWKDKVAAV